MLPWLFEGSLRDGMADRWQLRGGEGGKWRAQLIGEEGMCRLGGRG